MSQSLQKSNEIRCVCGGETYALLHDQPAWMFNDIITWYCKNSGANIRLCNVSVAAQCLKDSIAEINRKIEPLILEREKLTKQLEQVPMIEVEITCTKCTWDMQHSDHSLESIKKYWKDWNEHHKEKMQCVHDYSFKVVGNKQW